MELILQKGLPHQLTAVNAVCDVFRDIPFMPQTSSHQCPMLNYEAEETYRHIEEIQQANDISPACRKVHRDGTSIHLDIKMETGTGKTYVYTQTIFELHKRYGINKFIIFVPSLPVKAGTAQLNCTPKVRHKTLGVFFMKYSYEQRLIIVSRVKQGEAIAHLSKEYHISETEILAWVRMWDHYGRSGLEQQSHCRPTVKLKEEVVRLILEKGVPLAHVRVEYRIGKTALQRWVSVVRKYGYGALEPSKRRGRPPKYPMGRPKKKEPQTELERLQAENLRLKAENALLKKAKALVEAKKAQALLNGHGPSTN